MWMHLPEVLHSKCWLKQLDIQQGWMDEANQAPKLALIKERGDAKNPLAYIQEGNKDSLQ